MRRRPGAAGLTQEQRDILRHSLGLNYQRRPYRNHYCDADGAPKLERLVEMGLMERGITINGGRDRYYHVTPAGMTAVRRRPTPTPPTVVAPEAR